MNAVGHQVETLHGGVATPFSVAPGVVSGCLYGADGVRSELSRRFGGWRGDRFRSEDPDRLDPSTPIERLGGRALYLGHYMRHYGHFITETLSTFWIFDHVEPKDFDHFVFHRFAFGPGMAPYARFFLDVFGIPPEKVRIVDDRGLGFDEIVVPERLLRLNHSADPALRRVHGRIAAAARAGEGPPTPAKLYLSRRRRNLSARRRIIANEHAVEREFRTRGFTVIHPEEMDVAAQIRCYAGAAALAGPSGSGLHNSLFMRPGSLVIELGDPRYAGQPAPTQTLCDSVAGVRSVFAPFEGRVIGGDVVMLIDRGRLAARLDAAGADELDRAAAVGPAAGLLDSLAGWGEQTFILGRAWARRLAGRSAA